MNEQQLTSRFRSSFTRLVRNDAAPELDALQLVPARIVSQNPVSGMVSLQIVDRSGKYADTLPVHQWTGVAGVSWDPTPGQEVRLAFSQADKSDPVAFLASPKGQPGHVPLRVRHDAVEEIRMVGASEGVVRVGSTTVSVALEPPVKSFRDAVLAFATAAKASTTDPTLVAAATALESTLQGISDFAARKLEAQ